MTIRLSKIYTKTGDQGTTGLVSGSRVPKHDARVHAIGEVDEANATLGLAALHAEGDVLQRIRHIQNDMFDLGADMALPLPEGKPNSLRITEGQVSVLEALIDQANETLKPLDSFILPGGSPLSTTLHHARTVVRRAERAVVHVTLKEKINPLALQYLNRLSDLLFVMARVANDNGHNEVLWAPGAGRTEEE